ncbi:DNA processing protein [Solimonas aquatica]|uniref:DNA processing protein n=1 Tax=Solimonas aquatica TaxID=489703 RepID=A0A1H9F4A6_9GAMM|nr:DNA-processing protein DprA [Solimonas aquatica]SEQ32731.1 DNA processing protein [Solimonas aquatica]
MDDRETRAWLQLNRADGLGAGTLAMLVERFGSASTVVSSSPAALRGAGLSEAQAQALREADAAGIAADLDWLAQGNRRLLTLADAAYPPQLREIARPPPLLFCQGDTELLTLPQLAIVGARNATPQGLQNAHDFAAELARRGLVITSGLALGIDGAAHRGALSADAYTIAVCGTGLDRVYPARHKSLAHELAARGLLVSEFPTGVAALADHFPRRNRIISGLSLGVLVVEAARESGSLITARLALEQGREVMAIPGSIHNPQARGCHALIRQGAKLVETVDDVLEELGPLLGTRLAASIPAAARDAQQTARDPLTGRLLAALGDELLDVDALSARLGAPVSTIQAALTRLELEGGIAVTASGRYQRLSAAG